MERARGVSLWDTPVKRALMTCVPRALFPGFSKRVRVLRIVGTYPSFWECFGVVKSRTITAPWILHVVVATAG